MPPRPPRLRAANLALRQIVRRTETEPPSTMMLSHFSGGNPALFKAFMRRRISIILMYLKTNTVFRYSRAQIRTFQDVMRW